MGLDAEEMDGVTYTAQRKADTNRNTGTLSAFSERAPLHTSPKEGKIRIQNHSLNNYSIHH